jgi:hypothetical protein
MEFFAALSANILRGLHWVADHPTAVAVLVVGAVAGAMSAYLHVRCWRRNGA